MNQVYVAKYNNFHKSYDRRATREHYETAMRNKISFSPCGTLFCYAKPTAARSLNNKNIIDIHFSTIG